PISLCGAAPTATTRTSESGHEDREVMAGKTGGQQRSAQGRRDRRENEEALGHGYDGHPRAEGSGCPHEKTDCVRESAAARRGENETGQSHRRAGGRGGLPPAR